MYFGQKGSNKLVELKATPSVSSLVIVTSDYPWLKIQIKVIDTFNQKYRDMNIFSFCLPNKMKYVFLKYDKTS